MDLLLTINYNDILDKDKKPLAISQFKELVLQRYYISKHTNTSYVDAGKITPVEREYIIKFILDENKRNKEAWEKIKNKKEN